jgi:hypothetical protein
MNLCIFITEGTRMTCLERQYLSFIIPQIFTRLGGRLRQGLGHGLEKSTRVDLSQYINKNNYYNSFKTRLGSDLRQSSDHGWGELTWPT